MTGAQAIRGLAYSVLIATGILMGVEAIRGWIVLVLMVTGVAFVFLADHLKKT